MKLGGERVAGSREVKLPRQPKQPQMWYSVGWKWAKWGSKDWEGRAGSWQRCPRELLRAAAGSKQPSIFCACARVLERQPVGKTRGCEAATFEMSSQKLRCNSTPSPPGQQQSSRPHLSLFGPPLAQPKVMSGIASVWSQGCITLSAAHCSAFDTCDGLFLVSSDQRASPNDTAKFTF